MSKVITCDCCKRTDIRFPKAIEVAVPIPDGRHAYLTIRIDTAGVDICKNCMIRSVMEHGWKRLKLEDPCEEDCAGCKYWDGNICRKACNCHNNKTDPCWEAK